MKPFSSKKVMISSDKGLQQNPLALPANKGLYVGVSTAPPGQHPDVAGVKYLVAVTSNLKRSNEFVSKLFGSID